MLPDKQKCGMGKFYCALNYIENGSIVQKTLDTYEALHKKIFLRHILNRHTPTRTRMSKH